MNVVTRGVRNAFRNVTRTISIVVILGLSIGLSLVMLIAHQAVQNKIAATLSSIGDTVSILTPDGGPGAIASGGVSFLTNGELSRVRSIPHVTNVNGQLSDRIQPQGTTDSPGGSRGSQDYGSTTSIKSPFSLHCGANTCSGGNVMARCPAGCSASLPNNFSLSIPIIGATDPTNPSDIGASWLTILSGSAIDGSKDTDNAMISKAIADKNNLRIGSTFTAYDKSLTVAAIFNSDTQSGNSTIIVSLPTEQRLTGDASDVTTATATVDSLENLSSTTAAIRHALGSSASVTSNVSQANAALQPLNSVKNVSLYSLIGAVVAGATIVLLTMVMIVRERKREIGVFKAIGFSNLRIMFQFMAEALALTVLGAVVGVAVGIVGGKPVTTALVNNSTSSSSTAGGKGSGASFAGTITDIHTHIGWSVIFYGLGASILIALIGSALASFFISKVRPAEVLRSE